MGWFTSDIRTVEDLFTHSLQDIYYAEQRIEKALPEMIEKASDSELKKAFRTHLKQTKGQIKRLNQVFKKLKRCSSLPANYIEIVVGMNEGSSFPFHY